MIKKLTLLVSILLLVTATPAAPAGEVIGALRDYLYIAPARRPAFDQQPFANVALGKADADAARELLVRDHVAQVKAARIDEWNAHAIVNGTETMRFTAKTFGTRPAGGWNLYISLHGGGNTAPAVNDQQWKNQQVLYEPPDSLYIAPRAPTDSWNLWHESHIDGMIGRLIEDAIVFGGVDPNRVYLIGYSAGGDGVYQLAPRMADRLAAAAMMAGHPNDASPLGLRNLPFAIHVGALDDGYGRNKMAAQWGDQLDALQKVDPGGYVHQVALHPGMGHWMKRDDRVALPWMARFARDPLPLKIVWVQGHTPHDRFYWLANSGQSIKFGARVEAERQGQTIRIDRMTDIDRLDLLLNDTILDLDRPVIVLRGDQKVFDAIVPRTAHQLQNSIDARSDPDAIFSARLTVPTGRAS